MTTEFITHLMWSGRNELGVRLFLQQNGCTDFCVYECVLSEPLPYLAFVCEEKGLMYLKLKYQDINDAITQFICAHRRELYQMRLNQLYEQVESDGA